MKIVWSPLALERIAEIAQYIARDNLTVARRWVHHMFAKAALLSRFPERGRQVPETQRHDIREIISPPYRIIYRLKSDHIAILTVRHSKQRFSRAEVH